MKFFVILLLAVTTSPQAIFPNSQAWGGVSNDDRNFASLLLSSMNRNNFQTPAAAAGTLSRNDVCMTPDGQRGVCGRVTQCRVYMPFLRMINQQNVLNFFRQRICRLFATEVHLCCPTSPTTAPPSSSVSTSPPSSFTSQNNNGGNRLPAILPTEDFCGLTTGDRIVGGNEVEAGSWPWLAAIGWPVEGSNSFNFLCGGTLITTRHVLSASHCFPPVPTHVRVGEHSLRSPDDGAFPQDLRIRDMMNFGYNSVTKENDITLLFLSDDATFNDFVRPACLPINQPERDSGFEGEQMTVIGWGHQIFGDTMISDVPREVTIPVRPLGPCIEAYRNFSAIVDRRTICAGAEGRDSCSGDSGGPLNYFKESVRRYYFVGIVSHGEECALAQFPGVYTRVGYFIPQILRNLE